MLKVLRVSSNNPVSWQLSLVDCELDQILSGDSSIESVNHGCRTKQFLRKGDGMRGTSKLSNNEGK